MLALYLDHRLLYLSRQGISLGLELGDLASLASQLGLGKNQDYDWASMPIQLFVWVLRI